MYGRMGIGRVHVKNWILAEKICEFFFNNEHEQKKHGKNVGTKKIIVAGFSVKNKNYEMKIFKPKSIINFVDDETNDCKEDTSKSLKNKVNHLEKAFKLDKKDYEMSFFNKNVEPTESFLGCTEKNVPTKKC